MSFVFCDLLGVHHIRVNSEDGQLTISSTVDPHILLQMVSKVAKKAQLLYEQTPVWKNRNNVDVENGTKKAQLAPSGAQLNGFDLYHKAQLAQLQELAKNQRLKQLELTQSRNIKMTFRDNDDFTHGDGHTVKITMDNNPPPPPPVHAAGPSQCGHGGNSTTRGHDRSGAGEYGNAMKNGGPCCHVFEFNCGANKCCEEKAQRPLIPPNCIPHGPPPPATYTPYAAPPTNYYASYGSPPANALHADVNCGDEHKTCTMM